MSTEVTIQSFFPEARTNKVIPSTAQTFVGIDFGTSTTVVSIAAIDETRNLTIKTVWIEQLDEDGLSRVSSEKVPSVLAWHNEKLLVGKGAADLKYFKRRGVDVWYSFKMELGEDLGPKYCNSQLGQGHRVATILRPVDAASVFFKYLREEIEKYVENENLPKKIKYAISIPASFEANQRKDLITALETAGIPVSGQSLIDEPNAAFLSYIVETHTDQNAEKLYVPPGYPLHILVFDFGAGTCDISILEIGHGPDGLYSKNLSISRFEKLGGDDIDRLIAVKVLLDQILVESGCKRSDFRSPQINKAIIPKLMKPAEELKINICKSVALQYAMGEDLPALSDSSEKVTLGLPVEIELPRHVLRLNNPQMSYAQFKKIMGTFISTSSPKRDDFISIFNPVESALKKAGLEKDKIDYVLFIGGSSKSPYVQHALYRYFNESEMLFPRDLQTHVSAGAAIHSLIFNGFGKNIIRPITSEPIFIIASGGNLYPIVSAGTEIPSDEIEIDGFEIQSDGQRKIEIPICVTSADKILHIATITSKGSAGFRKKDPFKLLCRLTADKLLQIEGIVEGERYPIKSLSPLSNRPLNMHERAIYEAEREVNISAEQQGGIPSIRTLENLSKAYSDAGNHLRAAETFETCYEMNENSPNIDRYLGGMAFHYGRSGNREKSLKTYKLIYENRPDSLTAFNLAVTIGSGQPEEFSKYMEESLTKDSHNPYSLSVYGDFLMRGKDMKRGREMVKQAFEIFKGWYDSGSLDADDYQRLAMCASRLGENETANNVKREMSKEGSGLYREENLLSSKDSMPLSRRGE